MRMRLICVLKRKISGRMMSRWTAVMNYDDGKLRPFVIVQGKAGADDDLGLCDRLIYGSSEESDCAVGDGLFSCGIDDFLWATHWSNAYDRSGDLVGMLKPVTVWDCEVEAVNVKCFVAQHHTSDFYVFPYALDHHDYLCLTFSAAEGIDVDAARSFVTAVAGTIKLNKPYAPMCEEMLARAFREEVSPGEFAGMVDVYARAYVAAMKSVYAAARYKHLSETMTDPRLPESALAGVRGVLMLCDRAVPKFERLLDACEAQIGFGADDGEVDAMVRALEAFDRAVFPTVDSFDEDVAVVVGRAGILRPSPELIALRVRLEIIKERKPALIECDSRKRAAVALVAAALNAAVVGVSSNLVRGIAAATRKEAEIRDSYDMAVRAMERGTKDALVLARRKFDFCGEYGDSRALAKECRERIASLEEEERRAKEKRRAEEERLAKAARKEKSAKAVQEAKAEKAAQEAKGKKRFSYYVSLGLAVFVLVGTLVGLSLGSNLLIFAVLIAAVILFADLC